MVRTFLTPLLKIVAPSLSPIWLSPMWLPCYFYSTYHHLTYCAFVPASRKAMFSCILLIIPVKYFHWFSIIISRVPFFPLCSLGWHHFPLPIHIVLEVTYYFLTLDWKRFTQARCLPTDKIHSVSYTVHYLYRSLKDGPGGGWQAKPQVQCGSGGTHWAWHLWAQGASLPPVTGGVSMLKGKMHTADFPF